MNEVEYYKDNETQEYVVRYDGKIKPTFIDEHSELKNIIYFKDYVSDNRLDKLSNLQKSKYMKFINTGFEPLYPSIDYCSILSCNKWNYEKMPSINNSEFTDVKNKVKITKNSEYSWFDSGTSLILPTKIIIEYIHKKDDGKFNIDEIITNYFIKNFDITDSDKISYIKSLYTLEYNWEYYSLDNIDDYVYTIKLLLK